MGVVGVIVREHDRETRKQFVEALSAAGFYVLTPITADATFFVVRTLKAELAVVVNIDAEGLVLAEKLATLERRRCVIGLTARHPEDVPPKLFDALVRKPCRPDSIVDAVKGALVK
jgi:DNA-binding response OmpR family regulator